MNVALWIVQALLALVFLVTGFLKVSQPLSQLSKRMEWVKSVPPALVRFLGVAEILGAVGMVLPPLTGVMPWLTPVAAVGLMIVMVGASAHHASRREYRQVGLTLVLFLMAAFVAYGRFVVVPA